MVRWSGLTVAGLASSAALLQVIGMARQEIAPILLVLPIALATGWLATRSRAPAAPRQAARS